MKKYLFSYKDNEGDLFETDEFDSMAEVKEERKRLSNLYDGDWEIVETWIYKDNEFVGRF